MIGPTLYGLLIYLFSKSSYAFPKLFTFVLGHDVETIPYNPGTNRGKGNYVYLSHFKGSQSP